MNLKNVILEQLNYCNEIVKDILKYDKSKEIQLYAKQYAEVESPLIGGTEADWIRINFGDIYIFLHDNGEIQYQLDPIGNYGEELIDIYGSLNDFIEEIQRLDEEKIKDDYYYPKNWNLCNPREAFPLRTYMPYNN